MFQMSTILSLINLPLILIPILNHLGGLAGTQLFFHSENTVITNKHCGPWKVQMRPPSWHSG